MDQFIDACIDRWRTIILVLLLLLAVGWSAYNAIPKERSPDVKVPIIYVSMNHQGISPEDAERLLIKPMEKELRSIEGIKELTAAASLGHASVTLEFDAGFNSQKALDDVREKVDIAKAELPEDTDEPVIKEVNIGLFPILNVILTGNISNRTLVTVARDLQDKIESLPNVLEADIAGDLEDSVEIIIDPMMLQSYGLTTTDISSLSIDYNSLVAAGELQTEDGSFAVKVPGLLEDLDDILSLPLKHDGDALITIGDVATIKKTFKDATSVARVNGKPAVVLEISKRLGANLIETVDQIKELVASNGDMMPENLTVLYAQDNSSRVLEMLVDLQNNIILATLLVLVVTICVIGVRSAMLVSIAIPGAFLIGIVMLSQLDLTLNTVVLFSLILSIGMLVDSAIILCEMASRKMATGVPKLEAYASSAKYIKWPIITSTATTLVVFMPLLFWPGIIGQFMQYMPITLIATLSASMLMAIIFIPTLGTIFGRAQEADENVLAAEEGNLQNLVGVSQRYYNILVSVLARPWRYIVGMLVLLVAVFITFGMVGSTEFFPDVEPDNTVLQVQARGNLSLEEKDNILKLVEERVFAVKDEVETFYTRVGKAKGGNQSGPKDTIGSIQMEFVHWSQRRKATQIIDGLRELTSDIPGIQTSIGMEKSGPKSEKPIDIQLRSNYPELLDKTLEVLKDKMLHMDALVDVEDSRPPESIEWEIDIDRKRASRYGANVNNIGAFVKLVTNGLIASSYRPDDMDDEVDIVIRFPDQHRNVEMLQQLMVNTNQGTMPVSNFVTMKGKPTVESIERADGKRMLKLRSNVADGVNVNAVVAQMKQWIKDNPAPPGVDIVFKGDDEEQRKSGAFLMKAFLLAICLMALILVTQFNSIYYMVIILSAIILSTTGVFLGLIVTDQPFGIVMCGVGIISLSGIVVNNNIIFIDTYKKLRATGIDSMEAIIRTGVQRLRPILLTAGTTVLGLIPMVIGMNINFLTSEVTFGAPSGQWWQQLSTSIAGGLAFATILTLFITPCLLLVGTRLEQFNLEGLKKWIQTLLVSVLQRLPLPASFRR